MLVVEGVPKRVIETTWKLSIREQVDAYIAEGLSKMDAVKRVAKERGLPKNDVYKEMIEE